MDDKTLEGTSSEVHPLYVFGSEPELATSKSETQCDRSFTEANTMSKRRERRGDSLWRVLDERHLNMIAFSGTIGNGLFLGSGAAIAGAGPGGAVLAYVLMGTVFSSVISSVGEMTALMPVNAPVMEFPRRYLDRGVGFAVGYMYWFAYTVLSAEELVAVANTIRFEYNDKRTFLRWTIGMNVDPAVWIALFLSMAIVINLFPIRYFGELEYIFGSFKIAFISLLIILMLVLDIMKPRANAYYNSILGTKYWDSPYSFFNRTYDIKSEGGEERSLTGAVATFLGVWITMIRVAFSYTGMDIVVATGAESKALGDAESMKMAARKISLRIVVLYVLAVLVASFLVPSNHPFLNGGGQSVGSHSVFIIAAVEAGIPSAAHFFNAVFVFSSFTCAINSMYVASRVLHALALRDQTGPEFITRRLRHCRNGVPIRAVLMTGAVCLIGFSGRSGAPGVRLSELATNCTVSVLITYIVICATYLSFFKTLSEAKDNYTASEAQAASYDRDHPRYPYKSHGQWLKACYGMVACIILVLFNGLESFLERPFDVRRFVAAYLGIPVFLLLIIGYKLSRHGPRLSQWGLERSKEIRNTTQAESEKRKGRLEFPDNGTLELNVRAFVDWLWVWMK